MFRPVVDTVMGGCTVFAAGCGLHAWRCDMKQYMPGRSKHKEREAVRQMVVALFAVATLASAGIHLYLVRSRNYVTYQLNGRSFSKFMGMKGCDLSTLPKGITELEICSPFVTSDHLKACAQHWSELGSLALFGTPFDIDTVESLTNLKWLALIWCPGIERVDGATLMERFSQLCILEMETVAGAGHAWARLAAGEPFSEG